jgi:glycerate kinase
VPVVAVAGRTVLPDDALRAAGFSGAYALTDLDPDPRRCTSDAAPLLRRLASRIAHDHLTVPTREARP